MPLPVLIPMKPIPQEFDNECELIAADLEAIADDNTEAQN